MRFTLLSIFFVCTQFVQAQNPLIAPDALAQQQWVDSVYNTMTVSERIGQLFMVSVSSDQSKSATESLKQLIVKEGIGGVIFSKGGPMRQAKLNNDFQRASKYPLLIGMDAEWGLAMRLDSTYAFPWNMTLGAIPDTAVVARVGRQIGKHAKRLGVHINFAPDMDINTNPKNPIIGNRSFGEDRENVTQKALAFTQGMESAGVLSCGKHFPGHGDTAVDSHKALPLIPFSRRRLDSLELYPYQKLVHQGLSSVMIAHLDVPALEAREGYPSSLSKPIVTGLLQEEMGFEGLVFTDALNMQGVAAHAPEGEVELTAFLAGNDMLLMPRNVTKAKTQLVRAYNEGAITEGRLSRSVKKILMAKYKVGLNKGSEVDTENLLTDLNSLEDDLIYEEAIEKAITVVKNNFGMLPVKKLENKKIAYVKFGDASGDVFLKSLKKYAPVTEVKGKDLAQLKQGLREYNTIIVGLHRSNESPWKGHAFTQNELFWLHEIANVPTSNVILSVFTKPYALLNVHGTAPLDAVMVAYQNSTMAQEKAAEVIFGAIPAAGVLPVTAHPDFPVNTSVPTQAILRLGYSFPERVGLSSQGLTEVDSLMAEGLDNKMFPGAQVLVARKGKVVYNKTFGKHIYGSGASEVREDDIYDLASLTKILATLPMLMHLEEEGTLTLNQTFQELIPQYAESELKDVTVLKALSHYGRLPAWIAFYMDTLDKSKRPSPDFYRQKEEPGFTTRVTDHLYIADAYQDSIYNRIGRQSLKPNRYRYSDVGFYVFKKYIEDTLNQGLDDLATDFLYKPLGAYHLGYNPKEWYARNQIIPSEEDNYFRYKRIQGDVHDMGAAMQGGVGGHAGLFGNANDVAKVMQMYLQGGYYGGERFFSSRTVQKFNTCYFCDRDVRRGVGFDKPQLSGGGPACECVSAKSFGHSGFTGTYTWADPEEELVYVFLSNRTYPSASNTRLIKSGLRTRIQEAIYDAILY